MNVLIFDCESTGVPIDRHGAMSDVNNWPRVIQLAYMLIDIYTDEILHEHVCLIKPDGWEIPKEKFWIDNGFSTEINNELGVPMTEALDDFIVQLDKADVLCGHNLVGFDLPVVGAEMFRYGYEKKPVRKPNRQKIDTMVNEDIIKFCAIPFANSKFKKFTSFKWPSLAELHKKLFETDFEKGHDALEDVRATMKCFLKLLGMGFFTIEEPA